MSAQSYLDSIYSYSDQFNQAFSETQQTVISQDLSGISDIIIAGMGGSSFGGRFVKGAFSSDKLLIPVRVVSEYDLPSYADEKTLVIATSYSGNTEEVLAMKDQAKTRGCKLMGITSGGKLGDDIRGGLMDGYIFNPLHNPSGTPRTAIGYIVGATIGILSKLGHLNYKDNSAAETTAYIKSFTEIMQKEDRMTSQISQKILGKAPVFVSAEHLVEATHIWRNFLNETAKTVGFAYAIPDMNHHFLDGLLHPEDIRKHFVFIFIQSDLYNGQNKKRFEVSREVVKKHGISDISLTLNAKNPLHEMWELVVIGSIVSYNLAKIHNADPASNEMVDFLKSQL